jgi:hypothetical protein
MRRIAFSLIASCGLAALVACSGGGFGTNLATGTQAKVPDQIIFSDGNASVQDFFLDPTGNDPILVNAQGIKGTGAGTSVIPDMVFTWAAVYAASGTTYIKAASPTGTGTCGTPPSVQYPINSLLQQGTYSSTGTAPYPLYGGFYSQLLAQPPPASGPVGAYPTYTGLAATIFVGVPLVPGAASPYNPTTTAQLPTSATANYCIRVLATDPNSGKQGSVIIVISQSP